MPKMLKITLSERICMMFFIAMFYILTTINNAVKVLIGLFKLLIKW